MPGTTATIVLTSSKLVYSPSRFLVERLTAYSVVEKTTTTSAVQSIPLLPKSVKYRKL